LSYAGIFLPLYVPALPIDPVSLPLDGTLLGSASLRLRRNFPTALRPHSAN